MATKTITTKPTARKPIVPTNQPLYRMWGSRLVEKEAVGLCVPKFTEPCIPCCMGMREE